MKLTVIVPSLNEARSIGLTIMEVKQVVPDASVIVIDSHSTDGTPRIAIDNGANVMDVPKMGKGRAVRDAIPYLNGDYVVMMDADYTYPAIHIKDVVKSLESGADVVLGYRKDKADGSMTFTNKFGNLALSMLASILYGVYVRDVCTGLWGFRTEALKRLNLTSDRFTLEADLYISAVKCHCKIGQVPIYYRARMDKPKLKVRDGFDIGAFLIKGVLH